PNAFEEISGEVVKCALIVLKSCKPKIEHTFTAFRLIGLKNPQQKAEMLQNTKQTPAFVPLQSDLLAIAESPFVYWLRPHFFDLLKSRIRLQDVADVRVGLQTADNERFTRCFWEVSNLSVVEKD